MTFFKAFVFCKKYWKGMKQNEVLNVFWGKFINFHAVFRFYLKGGRNHIAFLSNFVPFCPEPGALSKAPSSPLSDTCQPLPPCCVLRGQHWLLPWPSSHCQISLEVTVLKLSTGVNLLSPAWGWHHSLQHRDLKAHLLSALGAATCVFAAPSRDDGISELRLKPTWSCHQTMAAPHSPLDSKVLSHPQDL